MNPCPCGFPGDAARECRCTPQQVARYAARLSGRCATGIDLTVGRRRPCRPSCPARAGQRVVGAIRARVDTARARQMARDGTLNARLQGRSLRARTPLAGEAPAHVRSGALSTGADRPRTTIAFSGSRGRSRISHGSDRIELPTISPRRCSSGVNERPCFCHFPPGQLRGRVFRSTKHDLGRAGGRRPRRAVPSRRYSIVIADCSSGVVRRFTLPLGPTITTTAVALALPILIGLGASWSARATGRRPHHHQRQVDGRERELPRSHRAAFVADLRAAGGR